MKAVRLASIEELLHHDDPELETIQVTPPAAPSFIRVSSGHVVRPAEGRGDAIEVRSAGGVLELELRFSPSGVVVSSPSGSIALQAAEDISIDCDRFRVRARRAVELESSGSVVVSALGDVDVHGEKVLLNC